MVDLTKRETVRGFYGIAVYAPKHYENIGTLFRSARAMGASMIFQIGRRYKLQKSDTGKAYRSIPFLEVENWESFLKIKPRDTTLVGCELTSRSSSLVNFVHPERAIYVLGSEDFGLQENVLRDCNTVVKIPSLTIESLNVAVAGSLILYDRQVKRGILK